MPSIPHIAEAKCVWLDNVLYECAEKNYHLAAAQGLRRVPSKNEAVKEIKNQDGKCSSSHVSRVENVAHMPKHKASTGSSSGNLSYLADEIARARQHIKNSLQCDEKLQDVGVPNDEVLRLAQKINDLESKNKQSEIAINALQKHINTLENRIAALEKPSKSTQKQEVTNREQQSKAAKVSSTSSPVVKKDDDDDVDLFGSDEDDDEENEKLKQERLKAYEAKKSKKPALIAKSNVILDVKPWDDETDMKEMERKVRDIQFDGLVWGASKLVPLAYGIHKLQISCVVEDEKVSVDLLQEQIEGLEDLVQSMDIAAFNKV